VSDIHPPGAGPGQFRAAWQGGPRHLAPFAIANPEVYVSPGPPALGGLDYAATFAEQKLLGNAAIPDAAKLATFQFWSLGNNTSQPPGAWLQVAITVSSNPSMTIGESARLFALQSLAMVDTVAPTYETKWQHFSWRPRTAIREATAPGDTNLLTDGDATWSPRSGSEGSSPEHWSGHSSFSGAGAKVLQGFFCADEIPFTLTTDSAPGGTPRRYPSFSAAEAEAGLSRVVGGIHFNFSNGPGIAAGRAIAAEVLATKLLLKRGPTHVGDCPR
jgi:hypothetical protein